MPSIEHTSLDFLCNLIPFSPIVRRVKYPGWGSRCWQNQWVTKMVFFFKGSMCIEIQITGNIEVMTISRLPESSTHSQAFVSTTANADSIIFTKLLHAYLRLSPGNANSYCKHNSSIIRLILIYELLLQTRPAAKWLKWWRELMLSLPSGLGNPRRPERPCYPQALQSDSLLFYQAQEIGYFWVGSGDNKHCGTHVSASLEFYWSLC